MHAARVFRLTALVAIASATVGCAGMAPTAPRPNAVGIIKVNCSKPAGNVPGEMALCDKVAEEACHGEAFFIDATPGAQPLVTNADATAVGATVAVSARYLCGAQSRA